LTNLGSRGSEGVTLDNRTRETKSFDPPKREGRIVRERRTMGCRLPDRGVEESHNSSGEREKKVLVIAIVLRGERSSDIKRLEGPVEPMRKTDITRRKH
jgi:hypothetical protein